jgi:hypothetical protein
VNPELNPVEAVALAIRAQATHELLALLSKSKTDKEAGRKALLIAFILDPALIGTQRELARRMGVSEGRASQMLKHIRRSFAHESAFKLTPR